MLQNKVVDQLDVTDLQVFVDVYLGEVKKVESNFKTFMKKARDDFARLKGQVYNKLTNV